MAAKYQQLAEILKSEISHILRQGGDKLPTEAELSQRYHMSRQTVRHALQILEDDGLILRRQGSGSYITEQVKDPSVRQIAVITSFLDDYIFPSVLHNAQSIFSQEGYSTLVYATENRVSNEREILTRLLKEPPSAILVEGSKTALPTPNADLYLKLRQIGIPVLFLHGIYSNLQGFPSMVDDNYSGGYQLCRYLIERGHSKIAGIFKSDDIQGPQRYHGVVNAIRDENLPIPDQSFYWYDTEDRSAMLEKNDLQVVDSFIRNRLPGSTAVVCYNDEIANLLIRRLLENGIQVPKDVAVVSFDNSYYCQISPVPITSLAHKSNRPGRAAAALLMEIIHGAPPRSVSLDWELTIRESG